MGKLETFLCVEIIISIVFLTMYFGYLLFSHI